MSLTILDTSYMWNHAVLSFCDWPVSLSKVSLRFICVVACHKLSFFLKENNNALYVYTTFTHSSFGGHLDCFHLLTFITNTAVNVGVYISLWDPAFSYCGCILKSFSQFFICHTLTAEFLFFFLYFFFTHVLYLVKYSLLMVFLSSLNISKTVVLKAVSRQSSMLELHQGSFLLLLFLFL